MTTLTHAVLPLPAASRPALWVRVARGSLQAFRVWNNRRAFSSLSELTDWQLTDIGVTRGDLIRAGAHGYGDPTARLSTIVSARLSLEDAARRVS